MKYHKKILVIIACIITSFTILKIADTYSLFESQIKGQTNSEVGAWIIKVNQQDITSKTSHDFIISDQNINIQHDENVVNNKMAPGTKGGFKINIKPEDTQVSIKYELQINKNKSVDSPIEISDVKSNNNLVKTDEYAYTGVILLKDINNEYEDEISIEFEWKNNEEKNEQDTNIGVKYNNLISIPVNIKFSQYLGEEIIPFDNGEEL